MRTKAATFLLRFFYNNNRKFEKPFFMAYSKQELLSLPPEERAALAEELWSSLENDALRVTEDEISFAEERLKLHNQNPDERLSLEDLKSFFNKKHGF